MSIDVAREADALGYSLRVGRPRRTRPRAWRCSARSRQVTRRTSASAPACVALQLRTPPLHAMAAATLQQLAGDRDVFLGVGISSPAVAGQWHGAGYTDRPIAQVREFVTLLRECLSGETVTFEGDFYTVKRFRLGVKLGDRQPKIALAALNEQMLPPRRRARRRGAAELPARRRSSRGASNASAKAATRRSSRTCTARSPIATATPTSPARTCSTTRSSTRTRTSSHAAASSTRSRTSKNRWAERDRDGALAAISDEMGRRDPDHGRRRARARRGAEVRRPRRRRPDRVRDPVGRRPPRDGQRDPPRSGVPTVATGELGLARAVLEERLHAGLARRRCRRPRRTRRVRGRGRRPASRRGRRRSPAWRGPSRRPRPRRARRPSAAPRLSTSSGAADPVDEPDRERLVGAHLTPAPDQLLGARRPDEARRAAACRRRRE